MGVWCGGVVGAQMSEEEMKAHIRDRVAKSMGKGKGPKPNANKGARCPPLPASLSVSLSVSLRRAGAWTSSLARHHSPYPH